MLPIRNQPYTFIIGLESQSTPGILLVHPNVASGDATKSLDQGASTALDTTPYIAPPSGKRVVVELTAAEMDADNVSIVFSDQAGDEWYDTQINIQPIGHILGGTVTDGAPSSTSFDTSLSESTNDHFNNEFLVFTDGALQGQSRKISDYAGSAGTITVSSAFTEAPPSGSPFIIVGRSE